MNFVILFVCSVILNFSIVPVNAQTNRIINGTVAKLGQFPYFALLRGNKSRLMCGGSIITDRWILSAAHCVPSQKFIPSELSNLEDSDIYVGSIRLKHGLKRTSKLQLMHPKYDEIKRENDIILLKLDQKIKYTEFIQKISLPEKWMTYNVITNYSFNVAGVGIVWNDTDTTVLRYTTFKLVDKNLCAGNDGNEVMAKEKLCAESYFLNISQNVCYGDSGSGLVTTIEGKLYIIGVVSYMTDLNCESRKGRFVSGAVLDYMDWINEVINNYNDYDD